MRRLIFHVSWSPAVQTACAWAIERLHKFPSVWILVVRISLVVQNACVILSALCVCVLLHFNEELHDWRRHLTEASIIILAVLANLASVAYKISVEKDWIVVVSQGDSSALASKPLFPPLEFFYFHTLQFALRYI